MHLMYVGGEWSDNAFTVEGRFHHMRVDGEEDPLPDPRDDPESPKSSRSVQLSSPTLGIIAKADLIETSGASAEPVEYKRGEVPDTPHRAWNPERIQLCAQGLLLREHGFTVDRGWLYFAGSRQRVEVSFTEELIEETRRCILDTLEAARGSLPAPLQDSRKCYGCSLNGICLPDETTLLTQDLPSAEMPRTEPRQLCPARNDALPLYVQTQGAHVGKSGETLVVTQKGQKLAESRLFETSQVCLMGNTQMSTQAIQECCRRGMPVVFMSTGGWFYGMTSGPMSRNAPLRLLQYEHYRNAASSLKFSRAFISGKIRNCRTILRRNAEQLEPSILSRLKESAEDAESAKSAESLLGIEGNAAKIYFQAFSSMLKKTAGPGASFSFDGRNRRPPRDPVNALLSLAYSLLAKEMVVVLAGIGFDPYLGFLHQPKPGKPCLALDLMEEFRPLICDSIVLMAVNTGMVAANDFVVTPAGVSLKDRARKAFIEAYERRLDQLIRHPIFGYQISYRRVLEVQARLLGRCLQGEISDYPAFLTR
ncbi:MAG TPA: CRISPR-associated endonuclease Cas1 [Candidatus Sumerlaeota bacterium]|nr:CRISPR-associated endonuclease Cas1 [Candidatus Sumerlaeota bacterium]